MLGKKKKGKDEHGGDAEATAPAAEGEAGAEGAEGAKKKGLPLKLIIIVVVGLLVIGGGGGTAAIFLMKSKHPPAKVAKVEPKKKKEKGKDAKPEEGMGKVSEGPDGISYYTFPSVLADMQGADGKPGQIKIAMTFEMANADIGDNINENMPRVKGMLQTFLRELRPEDIDGAEGNFRLQQELLRRVNLIIAPAKINTINLTEMVTS